MRTPLNGCLASAEMLLDTPLAEEQRELAKTIRVSGSILLSTVSNFLDFFKMEAGGWMGGGAKGDILEDGGGWVGWRARRDRGRGFNLVRRVGGGSSDG